MKNVKITYPSNSKLRKVEPSDVIKMAKFLILGGYNKEEKWHSIQWVNDETFVLNQSVTRIPLYNFKNYLYQLQSEYVVFSHAEQLTKEHYHILLELIDHNKHYILLHQGMDFSNIPPSFMKVAAKLIHDDFLSPNVDKKTVFDQVHSGENLIFIGRAGCGMVSKTQRHFLDSYQRVFSHDEVKEFGTLSPDHFIKQLIDNTNEFTQFFLTDAHLLPPSHLVAFIEEQPKLNVRFILGWNIHLEDKIPSSLLEMTKTLRFE